MSNILNASEQLEQSLTREPIGKPMLVALVFHAILFGLAASYAILAGLFPHRTSGVGGTGDAIAVQLVSSALPLPADEKPNDNVLATDTPSKAPVEATQKTKAAEDKSAIPIATKIEKPKKEDKTESTKIIRQTPTKQDNHAQYGEQASSRVDRSTPSVTGTTVGHSTVSSAGGQGFNYPWYIEGINRKINENSYRGEVDPRTPVGTRSNIQFTIRRDGSVSDVKMDKSSGSPTLDRSCLRAAQRVDTFGPLPSPPGNGPLIVSYYCEY